MMAGRRVRWTSAASGRSGKIEVESEDLIFLLPSIGLVDMATMQQREN
jgi:hypothetical protein